mgnify:CR=1 FL=1
MADALFVWVIRARPVKRAVIPSREIIIDHFVHVKRTLNRSPIYLAQFYCKLLQRLQEMKIVQNLQELRSYLTMEVGDNLKSRLDLHEKINASPQYIWRKNLSKTEMRYSNLVS